MPPWQVVEARMNTYFFTGCFAVALALGGFSVPAQAKGRDQWCDKYARIAVAQFQEANGFNRCRRRDGRWHNDALTHFNWCMKAQEDAVVAEDGARRSHLAGCKGSGL